MSIWIDVAFDHGAAAAAADACRRAAAEMDTAAQGATSAAGDVIVDWAGMARDGFDPAAAATTGLMVDAGAACLALAEAIEAASEAATAEQQRREEAREAEREAQRREEQRRREAARDGRPVPQ